MKTEYSSLKADEPFFIDLELDSTGPDTFQPVEISGVKSGDPVKRLEIGPNILDPEFEDAVLKS